MLEKIYIVAFLLLYFLIVFIIPSLRVKRKTGINPYVFKNTDSAQDYLGKVSKPITAILFILALVNLIYPAVLPYLGSFSWLEVSISKIAGFILIHLALLWIVIAQIQMSNSWRVGIDHSAKTELKTNGVFSVSRNPVFLGMLVTLTGFFLIIPNAFTLVAFVTSLLLFQVQVRLEEEYLYKTHKDEYIEYTRKVRRWL
jgi:protein-S-isoprenylcysteine O-methyltransferase Ste14